MILVPLTLGGFTFSESELEVPDELDDLGGTQRVAQRDFPGGIRTHQTFGYFPSPIRWRARFSAGEASNRAEQVKRILYAGQEVQLSWGERAWLGRLVRFSLASRHLWLFSYEVEFWPRLDISSGQGETSGAPDPTLLMNLQLLALSSMLYTTDGVFFPFIAPTVAVPVLALITAVNIATLAAGGVVAAIDVAGQIAIQAAAAAVQVATAPLQALVDPILASPAWDIASRAIVISNLVVAAQNPKWVVQAINPNLLSLSAQYYGDATLWSVIAAANGLNDPQPIGVFQLMIPPPA